MGSKLRFSKFHKIHRNLVRNFSLSNQYSSEGPNIYHNIPDLFYSCAINSSNPSGPYPKRYQTWPIVLQQGLLWFLCLVCGFIVFCVFFFSFFPPPFYLFSSFFFLFLSFFIFFFFPNSELNQRSTFVFDKWVLLLWNTWLQWMSLCLILSKVTFHILITIQKWRNSLSPPQVPTYGLSAYLLPTTFGFLFYFCFLLNNTRYKKNLNLKETINLPSHTLQFVQGP